MDLFWIISFPLAFIVHDGEEIVIQHKWMLTHKKISKSKACHLSLVQPFNHSFRDGCTGGTDSFASCDSVHSYRWRVCNRIMDCVIYGVLGTLCYSYCAGRYGKGVRSRTRDIYFDVALCVFRDKSNL